MPQYLTFLVPNNTARLLRVSAVTGRFAYGIFFGSLMS